MKLHNAIIITDVGTELRLSIADQPNFTGNVIFAREKLPRDLAEMLDLATGRSSDNDAAAADLSRATVQPELVS